MFDFAWSEFALIAVVALIAIGPKDMPVALKAVTGWIKKARRMAAEFQTHVDEMMREADLHEVRASIDEIRNFDIKGEIERTIDSDGSLRATFAENPLEPAAATAAVSSVEEIAIAETAVMEPEAPPHEEPKPCVPLAPAFVPPNMVLPAKAGGAAEVEAPAFIPPDVALQRHAREH
jgi:sec-independent protein translocase protein TatB